MDPSIVDVLKRAIQDAQELVSSEIALAKAEARQEIRKLAGIAALFAAAAAGAAIGLVFLLAAIAFGLSEAFGWPVWSGFAAVAIVMMILAAMLVIAGRSRAQNAPHMPLTTETLKENATWMRARTR